MKKLSEIKPLLIEDWAGKTVEQVFENFKTEWQASPDELKGLVLLVAYESVGSWGCDSSAWFLFRVGRNLFEVSGSHCSCYGFEGQFKLEATNREYLKSDKFSLSCGGYDNNPAGNLDAVKQWIAENL